MDKLRSVCRYFINKSQEDQISLTNKKLQKMIFYAQMYSLHESKHRRYSKSKLLEGVRFEAWIHGAVIPEVYELYRVFGRRDIVDDSLNEVSKDKHLDKEDRDLLDTVWEKCSRYEGSFLEKINHQGQPWIIARGNLEKHQLSNEEIKESDMLEHASHELKQLNLIQ